MDTVKEAVEQKEAIDSSDSDSEETTECQCRCRCPPRIDADDLSDLVHGCGVYTKNKPVVTVGESSDYVDIKIYDDDRYTPLFNYNVASAGAKAYLVFTPTYTYRGLSRRTLCIHDEWNEKEMVDELGKSGFDAAQRIRSAMLSFLRDDRFIRKR